MRSTRSILLAVILLASWSFADKINITIGYLPMITTGRTFLLREAYTISGAVTMALENIRKDSTILQDVEISLEWHDTHGRNAFLQNLIAGMRSRGVVALFGPTVLCYNNTFVKGTGNLPVMTYSCLDHKASWMKNFVRFEPPDSQAMKAVISFLSHYRYNNFSIIYVEGLKFAAEYLEIHAKSKNMTVNHKFMFNVFSSMEYYTQVINNTKNDTRIYVFLNNIKYVSSSDALLDVLDAMDRLHLFDKGEYLVIIVDIYVDDANDDILKNTFQYLIGRLERYENVTCPDSAGFKRRAQSIIIVKSSGPTSLEYEAFTKNVKEYSTKAPFNFKIPPIFSKYAASIPVPIHAAYLYNSIKTYALTLDFLIKEYVKKHDTPLTRDVLMAIASNGSLIVDTMVKNSPYPSITGQSIYLDEQAESKGYYSLLSFQPMEFDPDRNINCTHGMATVGQFIWTYDPYPEFKMDPRFTINWPEGSQPKNFTEDSPTCENEQEKYSPFDPTAIIVVTVLAILLLCVFYLYRKRRFDITRNGKFGIGMNFLTKYRNI